MHVSAPAQYQRWKTNRPFTAPTQKNARQVRTELTRYGSTALYGERNFQTNGLSGSAPVSTNAMKVTDAARMGEAPSRFKPYSSRIIVSIQRFRSEVIRETI